MESTDWNNPVIKLGDIWDLGERLGEDVLDEYAAQEWEYEKQEHDWGW